MRAAEVATSAVLAIVRYLLPVDDGGRNQSIRKAATGAGGEVSAGADDQAAGIGLLAVPETVESLTPMAWRGLPFGVVNLATSRWRMHLDSQNGRIVFCSCHQF
jgi:hypothetical protein